MLILSSVVMLLVIFLVGVVVQKLLNETFSVSKVVMLGFLALQAVFHIIAYPMIKLDASFSLLFWVYTGIMLLFSLSGIWFFSRKEYCTDVRLNMGEFCSQICKEPLVPMMTAGIIGLFFFVSLGYVYNTSDDSYYLPRAMEILAQNRLGILHGFGWSGIHETSFSSTVDASTLEAWKAYWSALFCMHPTVFSRNTLSFVIHVVSFCSLYQAFSSISTHGKKAVLGNVFLCVYVMLILLDNRISNTSAFWTLRYPSQGKSLLCSIIYPALIYGCVQIVNCGQENIPWRKWLFISVTFTAGVSSTIIGVYWPFLCCLTMGIPYLLLERRKDLFKLLWPLFLTCLPIVVYAGISYLTILTTPTNYFGYSVPDWSEALSSGLNTARIDVLLLCILFALICGSKSAKMVIAGGCITLFLTFANPVLIGFVSKYLTTGSVYFRLFWMVPTYFLAAYAVAEIYGYCQLRPRQIAVLVISAVIVFSGSVGVLRLGPNGFYGMINKKINLNLNCQRRTNLYGINKFWINLGSKLLEDTEKNERIRVMWLVDRDCYLRQYSERIEVVGACRNSQWKYYDQLIEAADVAPIVLYKDFMQDDKKNFSDIDWSHKQLLASGIDYICVNEYSEFYTDNSGLSGFELVFNSDGIATYHVIG